MRYPPIVARLACLFGVLGALSVPAAVSAQEELLPNLKAYPASDIAVVPDFLGGTVVEFTTLTWNPGAGALEVYAGVTGSGVRNVRQRIYLEGGGSIDRLAGTFVYHEAHEHIHFEDYALYTLQPVDANGGAERTIGWIYVTLDRIDPVCFVLFVFEFERLGGMAKLDCLSKRE